MNVRRAALFAPASTPNCTSVATSVRAAASGRSARYCPKLMLGVGDRGVRRILQQRGDLLAGGVARQEVRDEIAQAHLAELLGQVLHGQQFGAHFDAAVEDRPQRGRPIDAPRSRYLL
jgi:hypothetical protein